MFMIKLIQEEENKMLYKRIFVIVTDSMGIGEAKDAEKYNDLGANTLGHISNNYKGFRAPTLEKLGIGYLTECERISACLAPQGIVGKMGELSVGKDTLTGHFELMGLEVTTPFPSFTETGFPLELIEELEKEPDEIDGLIMGPNHAFPMHELRAKTPQKYPMRFYPDITHNVRCEYPVHFLNDDWHYAFASTLSRESVNPRPVELHTLHRLFSHYTVGSVSYSEGVHDDLNKMVWSLLEFDDTYPLNEAVGDYVRYFFYGTDTESLTDAIFGLEKNWEGNPLDNPSINSTYRAFCELKHDYPALSTNWRFLLLYFRACCDKLVLERMKFETYIPP